MVLRVTGPEENILSVPWTELQAQRIWPSSPSMNRKQSLTVGLHLA